MRLSFLLTLFSLAGRFGYGFSSISRKTLIPSTTSFNNHHYNIVMMLPSTHSNTPFSASLGSSGSSSTPFVSHVPPVVHHLHVATLRRRHHHHHRSIPLVPRGGGPLGISNRTPFSTGTKCPMRNLATVLASFYGTFGVLYNLSKAIRRVLPIALEPFTTGAPRPLTPLELLAYVVTCLWFAYVEGYRGFQQKLSPLVVKRSFSLIVGQSHPLHFVLAPYYSLGLFHASKRRMITSWSVTVGIAGIIIAVKQLPYPWRNIIDAGVVAGLTWGSLSMLVFYIMSWVTGSPPDIDAAMPEPKIVVGKGAGAGDGGASK